MIHFRLQSRTLLATSLVPVLVAAGILLAACIPPTPVASPPRVFFSEPSDGEAVSGPLKVQMGAENFQIEPSGEVKEGAGHLHIMVDASCIDAGQVIPKDDSHIHYGGGQIAAELELTPGEHTLCLQAADGAHIALAGDGMTHEISVAAK